MKKILICFFAIGSFAAFSQEAVSTTGTTVSGSGGTVSYTVGQVAYTAKSNGSSSSNEGVQQTFKIVDDAGVQNQNFLLNVKTFPNPTQDFVQLEIKDLQNQKFTYVLFDANGKELQNAQILSETTILDLANYAKGTYLLKVNKGSEVMRSFTIINN
ncbi:T9SS type A sorting domain-containing protein [Paracrocinitomix mangrovi]|uniref:T9SS type A sorting domain-containing protein n=1 Tax=Paracrocinitomix mangrovi TaxID=2862509 RepID=UPI001C8EB34C|nr:T9SS type A sorting domain-containing protein [Paracrocinitomix mangrovi]UKN00764.1 T9SS type A sorting domain-containing protein [Paracrocinitomix mangrovi]